MTKKKQKWDYGWQEALHSAYIIMDSFEKYVAEHPKVSGNKKLKRQAEKTFDELWEMYQQIGGIDIR